VFLPSVVSGQQSLSCDQRTMTILGALGSYPSHNGDVCIHGDDDDDDDGGSSGGGVMRDIQTFES